MASTSPHPNPEPVAFEAIEEQKENIQPVREGRSATALARIFSMPAGEVKESQKVERDQFEQLIANSGELDDPLDPYLEYIAWVVENFPQGQSADSGLVQLLERCTSEFRDTQYYKDDPRYLKVWMRYINYSDAPREMFLYLARKEIGKNLATFYEEYANYLEVNNKRGQATQVYEAGIQLRARPFERLQRKYREFCERLAANPPDAGEDQSPALPVARMALSVKQESGELFSAESSSAEASRPKLQVFSDPSGKFSDKSGASTSGGWDSIGSLASRKKENVMEARPWVGQTMPSSVSVPRTKMAIFKDPVPGGGLKQPEIVNGKRPEKIAIALDFLHDENGEEYCLEEVLARSRKILDLVYPLEKPKTQTSTISLADDDDMPRRPASPTMTMHTKAATDEIYEMFNQPLQHHSSSESSSDNDDGNDGDDGDDDDFNDHSEMDD